MIIPPSRDGRAGGCQSPRGPPCSAWERWHVWHERTHSATSTSWHTQKARRRTSDPVSARPKCEVYGSLTDEKVIIRDIAYGQARPKTGRSVARLVAQHLRAQPASRADAEAVLLAL